MGSATARWPGAEVIVPPWIVKSVAIPCFFANCKTL